MPSLFLPALLLLAPVAMSADPTAEGAVDLPDAPAEPTIEDDLAEAKRAYLLREHDRARRLFESIVARANILKDVPFAVETSALLFLGEIHLLGGDRSGAEAAFRSVLERDITYQISPYDHPTDVLWTFQSVRETIERERAQIVPSGPTVYPWWGYAPFGVPQFRQKKPVRGTLYAILQTSFAAASVGAWIAIDGLQGDIPDDADNDLEDPSRRRAIFVRNTISTPSAAAFYATWAISVGDGAISWRKSQRTPPPSLTWMPMEGGGGRIVVAGTF